jgi:hypothetical protein
MVESDSEAADAEPASAATAVLIFVALVVTGYALWAPDDWPFAPSV